MPSEEKALLVLLGHAVNEINVLNKTFYIATQFDEEPQWRVHAHVSQSLVFARSLVGKLNEAWELLQRGYFGSKLSKAYHDHLKPDAGSALEKLKRYFGHENMIVAVRNRFAFHYSLRDAKTTLDRDLDDEEMVMYIARDNGNTLFYFFEYVIGRALVEAIEPGAPEAALSRLMTETSQVVGWFNDLAGGIMTHIVETYLLGFDGKLALEPIDIGTVPAAEALEIPYFLTTNVQSAAGS